MNNEMILKSIGDRIKRIDDKLTLADIIKYYGTDFPIGCLISSNLTPNEQRALGLIGGTK